MTHAIIYQTIERLKDDVLKRKIIRAMKLQTEGVAHFHSGDHIEAVQKLEQAIDLIEPIKEAKLINAMILGSIIGPYIQINRIEKAIATGKEAEKWLATDGLLAFQYAQTLHDLGAAYIMNNQLEEGRIYFERALNIYKKIPLPDEAKLRMCLRNIERVKKLSATQKSSGSFWSKLFKKK